MVNLDKAYRVSNICEDILPSIVNSYKESFWTYDEAVGKLEDYMNQALALTDIETTVAYIKCSHKRQLNEVEMHKKVIGGM